MSLLRALAFVFTLGCVLAARPARAAANVVYVVPIRGIIDLGLAPFVQRVLDEAGDTNAAAVVLVIDTHGGRVDAAVAIRDSLLRARVRTIAFIDKRAISAGALIALAAETIVMADGGTVGAATPVQMSAEGAAQPVSEKTVSYVRKEFRATAESRNRPPLVAEAMVDPDVEIEGLIAKGKLLTLTTTEAVERKVADFRADDLDTLLARLDLGSAELRHRTPNWAERVVRFFTHPVLSSLLISIAILGILLELRTPGFGAPGVVGLAALALFFWGHAIVRLVGWEEVLLIVLGLALIAVEVFVIPGFSVAGVLGAVALFAGLTMSLFGAGVSVQGVVDALFRVLVSLLLAFAAAVVLLRFLPRLPFGRRLVLASELKSTESEGARDSRPVVGRAGVAVSPLRPAGIAQIDGERVDVVSDGAFVESGQRIEVMRVDGNRIVVRLVRDSAATAPPRESLDSRRT